jgi:hypothetical protein
MEPRELIHHIEETRTSAKEYTGGFEITGGSRQEGLLYVSSWAGTKLERCYQIRTSEQLEGVRHRDEYK